MHEMSPLLEFAHTLHWYALAFMGLVYIIRIRWFVKRFKAGGERQAATGVPGRTTPSKGILYSWGNVAMPWAMESSRTKPFFYAQFVAFHLGVTSAILLLLRHPSGPRGFWRTRQWCSPSGFLIGAAFLVGLGQDRPPVRGQVHEGHQHPGRLLLADPADGLVLLRLPGGAELRRRTASGTCWPTSSWRPSSWSTSPSARSPTTSTTPSPATTSERAWGTEACSQSFAVRPAGRPEERREQTDERQPRTDPKRPRRSSSEWGRSSTGRWRAPFWLVSTAACVPTPVTTSWPIRVTRPTRRPTRPTGSARSSNGISTGPAG